MIDVRFQMQYLAELLADPPTASIVRTVLVSPMPVLPDHRNVIDDTANATHYR